MKTIITGAGGQLGQALKDTAPTGMEIVAATSKMLDIGDARAVDAFIATEKPNLIINAAAYTAVDKAEHDVETAYRVNGDAVGYLKQAANAGNAQLVHVSTDFVFDGEAGRPYQTNAPTLPIGVYGASKLRGEQEAGNHTLIVRTAWVYSSRGNNFVRTMLRLMKERDVLNVVADQIGTPTWANSLADGIWKLATMQARGIYHYTDSGTASWYDFAVAIQEEALAAGILAHAIPILPISTDAYPTLAKRPHYSVLDKTATIAAIGVPAPHWRVNLREMIAQLRNEA